MKPPNRFSRLPTAPVQRYLRWIQVTLYAASCIFAMVSCITLKVSYEDLGFECPLYAKPSKVSLQPTKNGTFVLHLGDEVKKGEKKTCYYSMYLNITIASYSLLWGLLYGFLSAPTKVRKGHLRHLIFPSLLFNSVLFTSELIASCVLSLGYNHWCNSIVNDLEASESVKKLIENKQLVLTCPLIQTFPWKFDDKSIEYFTGPRFFGLITIAQISSWMVSLTTLALSAICGERFFKAVWFGEQEQEQLAAEAAAAAASMGSGAGVVDNSRRGSSPGVKIPQAGQPQPQPSSSLSRTPLNGIIRENQGAVAAASKDASQQPPLLLQHHHQQQQTAGVAGTAQTPGGSSVTAGSRQQPPALRNPGRNVSAASSSAAAPVASSAIVSSPSDSAASEEMEALQHHQHQHLGQQRPLAPIGLSATLPAVVAAAGGGPSCALAGSGTGSVANSNTGSLQRPHHQQHHHHHHQHQLSAGSIGLGGLGEHRGLVTSAHLHAPAVGCLQMSRQPLLGPGPPAGGAAAATVSATAMTGSAASAYQETALWEPRQLHQHQHQQQQQMQYYPFSSPSAVTATTTLTHCPAAKLQRRIWNSSAQCSECLTLQQQYPHGFFYGPSRLDFAWRDQY